MAFLETTKNNITWLSSDVLPVKHLFTARLGEVGEFPYSSNYDPVWLAPKRQGRVRSLWLDLVEGGGFPKGGLCFTRQVHGTTVRYVTADDRQMPPLDRLPPDCDALVTDVPGLPIVVFTADCVPVLLCDRQAGVVAAAHCGWKGTVKDMPAAVVKAMTDRGAKPENIRIAIGPAISKCCFETGPEVPEAVYDLLGADAEGLCPPEEGVPGKFMVDLKEVNRRRFLQLGILPEHIDVTGECTMCQSDKYWSHRATKGVRGTQASIIML